MRPHPRRTSAGGCARPRHPPHKPGKGIRNVQPTAVRRPQPLSTGDSKKTSGRGRGEGRKRAGELVTEGRARHERCPRGRQWHPRFGETVVVATAVDGDGPWCGARRNDPRARMACRGRPCLHRLQRVACTHASTIKTIRIQVHEHETCVSVHHTCESQHKNVMKILFEIHYFHVARRKGRNSSTIVGGQSRQSSSAPDHSRPRASAGHDVVRRPPATASVTATASSACGVCPRASRRRPCVPVGHLRCCTVPAVPYCRVRQVRPGRAPRRVAATASPSHAAAATVGHGVLSFGCALPRRTASRATRCSLLHPLRFSFFCCAGSVVPIPPLPCHFGSCISSAYPRPDPSPPPSPSPPRAFPGTLSPPPLSLHSTPTPLPSPPPRRFRHGGRRLYQVSHGRPQRGGAADAGGRHAGPSL